MNGTAVEAEAPPKPPSRASSAAPSSGDHHGPGPADSAVAPSSDSLPANSTAGGTSASMTSPKAPGKGDGYGSRSPGGGGGDSGASGIVSVGGENFVLRDPSDRRGRDDKKRVDGGTGSKTDGVRAVAGAAGPVGAGGSVGESAGAVSAAGQSGGASARVGAAGQGGPAMAPAGRGLPSQPVDTAEEAPARLSGGRKPSWPSGHFLIVDEDEGGAAPQPAPAAPSVVGWASGLFR